MNRISARPWEGAQSILGALSGKSITIPNANPAPMPSLAATGVIHNGEPAPDFGRIDGARGYPDVRSFRRKFGLLIPATNTTMEHELWSLICRNPDLDGIGLHTANVTTPKPKFGTAEELLEYKRQFLDGLKAATEQVLLAQPQYLIMGMSLEHIINGIEGIRAPVAELEARSGLSWATWHDAASAALAKFGARRIGLLTPFEKTGNENASRMFEDLGFEVVSSPQSVSAASTRCMLRTCPIGRRRRRSWSCSPPRTTGSTRSFSAAPT